VTETVLKIATLITTSTEFLRQQLLKYNSNVTIVPITIDENLWLPRNLQRKLELNLGEKSLFLGIAGDGGEGINLGLIKEVVESVIQKEKEVFLALIGLGSNFFDVPPERQLSFSPLLFSDYQKLLDIVDIALLPLESSSASLYKSPIKVLEWGAKGIPVIASKVGPYLKLAEEGAPILLADSQKEWTEHLVSLIKQPELRYKKGEELLHYVRKHHSLTNCLDQYRAIFEQAFQQVRLDG
jgi:glycosyltransferase involved in cell wall biosynthesis